MYKYTHADRRENQKITFWQESSVYEARLHQEGRQEEAHGRAEVDEGGGRAAVSPQAVGYACSDQTQEEEPL